MVKYEEKGRYLELYFDSKPTLNIRDTLKVCGWNWDGKKKCWRAIKEEENMMIAKGICDECNPKPTNPILTLKKKYLDVENVIVRYSGFACNAKHHVEDVAGVLDVFNIHGEIEQYLVPISYCAECEVYYILEETYKKIKCKGVVATQILSPTAYKNYGKEPLETGNWKEESPLKIMGYSVSEKDRLSTEQRHAILERIINRGVMSKDQVLNYLDFFGRLGSLHETAAAKWKDDREYIETYNLDKVRRIVVGKMLMLY